MGVKTHIVGVDLCSRRSGSAVIPDTRIGLAGLGPSPTKSGVSADPLGLYRSSGPLFSEESGAESSPDQLGIPTFVKSCHLIGTGKCLHPFAGRVAKLFPQCRIVSEGGEG